MSERKRVNWILVLALASGVAAVLMTLSLIPLWAGIIFLFVAFIVAGGLQAVRYGPKRKKRNWG